MGIIKDEAEISEGYVRFDDIGGEFPDVDSLDVKDIVPYLDVLDECDEDTLQEILTLVKKLERVSTKEKSKSDFLTFVRAMWPKFISGYHHKIVADAFERLAAGKIKRLCISMPPRHTKSELGSHMLPAWWLGKFPDHQVIQASNTADLAKSFGRKVRDLVATQEYQEIFPGTSLRSDAKAAGQWLTSGGGTYYAVGVGGAIAGRGADLCIIDDPVTDQEGMSIDPKTFEDTYEWFTTGPRQRLQPGGRIVIIMTRWNKGDLIGRVLKKAAQDGDLDEWEVIELPAILPSGKPLWPEYWPLEELLKVKKDIPPQKWMAQYMQTPSSEENAIVKRDWWKTWEDDTPPKLEFVIQSWDTAHTAKNYSDYSAVTTWGVFYRDDNTGRSRTNIILLDAERERLEFPELKKKAWEKYQKYKPDCLVIEAKAAGWPLISELRSRGIPVEEFTPVRGNDKIVRINAVADMFHSGIIWAPKGRTFSAEVIEEFAEFPNGEHDDYVDSSTQALLRFRQGGLISLSTDWEDDEEYDTYEPKEFY